MLVFLPDEALHARIGFVDIGGNGRLDVSRVEDLVHQGVAVRFHILREFDQNLSRLSPVYCSRDTHIDLVRCPTIHTQGFNLGDMGAHFPMQSSAAHTQENAHLYSIRSASGLS